MSQQPRSLVVGACFLPVARVAEELTVLRFASATLSYRDDVIALEALGRSTLDAFSFTPFMYELHHPWSESLPIPSLHERAIVEVTRMLRTVSQVWRGAVVRKIAGNSRAVVPCYDRNCTSAAAGTDVLALVGLYPLVDSDVSPVFDTGVMTMDEARDTLRPMRTFHDYALATAACTERGLLLHASDPFIKGLQPPPMAVHRDTSRHDHPPADANSALIARVS